MPVGACHAIHMRFQARDALGEPEIAELDFPGIPVDQGVLAFNVPVKHAFLMQVLQGLQDDRPPVRTPLACWLPWAQAASAPHLQHLSGIVGHVGFLLGKRELVLKNQRVQGAAVHLIHSPPPMSPTE